MVIHLTLIDFECLSQDLLKRIHILQQPDLYLIASINCTATLIALQFKAKTLKLKLIWDLRSDSVAGIYDF